MKKITFTLDLVPISSPQAAFAMEKPLSKPYTKLVDIVEDMITTAEEQHLPIPPGLTRPMRGTEVTA